MSIFEKMMAKKGKPLAKPLKKGQVSKFPEVPELPIIDIFKDVFGGMDTSREEDLLFHCSSLHACARDTWFNWTYGKPDNKKGKPSWTGQVIFALGHAVHSILENALTLATKLKFLNDFQAEVTLEWLEERIVGTCDGILTYKGHKYIIEFKSCSQEKFVEFLIEPAQYHLMQVQAYLKMSGINVGYLVYFDKNKCRFHAYRVEYDEQYVTAAIVNKTRHVRSCMNLNKVPDRYLNCSVLTNPNKECPNYLRCKKYEQKGILPETTDGKTEKSKSKPSAGATARKSSKSKKKSEL